MTTFDTQKMFVTIMGSFNVLSCDQVLEDATFDALLVILAVAFVVEFCVEVMSFIFSLRFEMQGMNKAIKS